MRRRAHEITLSIYSSGPLDAARAVESWVRDNVRVDDEPDELLIDPLVMLADIASRGAAWGDCDDVAMLTAALLYSLGQRVRFKAIQQAADGSYRHVFTEVYLNGWMPIDPTIDSTPVYDPNDALILEV